MKRTTILGLASAFIAALTLFASPASAAGTYGPPVTINGVTCRAWTASGSSYPGDGSHLYDCVTPVGGAEPQHLRDIYGRVKSIQVGASTAYNLFVAQDQTYFYFSNRAAMNSYLSGSASFSGATFQNTTARCGNTAAKPSTDMLGNVHQHMESSAFETCQLAGSTIPNPNIADVVSHESGHAFDFALAFAHSITYTNKPSASPAFKRLVDGPNTTGPAVRSDMFFIDLGVTGQSAPATCSMFPNYAPSSLEQDLGLPTINMTPVCHSSGSTLVVDSAYSGLTNSQIAKKESPYFIFDLGSGTDPYSELFAQLFARNIGTGSQVQAPSSTPDAGPALPFINKVAPFFRCANAAVQNLRSGNSPVPSITSCPATTINEFYQQ